MDEKRLIQCLWSGASAAVFKEDLAEVKTSDWTQEEARASALMWAALMHKNEELRALLDAGAPVNPKDKSGKTALIWAMMKGNQEGARLLVQAGASLNERDEEGMSALHYAIASALWSAPSLMEWVAAGADARLKNNKGETPLDLALRLGESYARDFRGALKALEERQTLGVESSMIGDQKKGPRI